MEADREAKGRDRRRATKKVEEALARGRIVAADADLRRMQIESATMVSDLDRLVRDLAPAPSSGATAPGAAAPAAPAPAAPTPAPPPAAGPTSGPPAGPSGPVFAPGPVWQPPAADHREDDDDREDDNGRPVGPLMKPRRKRKASPVAIAVVGAALVASFVSRGDDSGSSEELTAVAAGEMLTEVGFRELVDVLETDTGSATVLDATLHPTYADVVLAIEPGGRTGRTFRYDAGGLVPFDGAEVRGRPIDLATIEPRAVTVAVRESEALIDGFPTGTFVTVSPSRRGPVVRSVSDDGTGGTTYAVVDADGRLVGTTGP